MYLLIEVGWLLSQEAKIETEEGGWDCGDGTGAARAHQVFECPGEAAVPALLFSPTLALLRTFNTYYPSLSLNA